MCLDAAHQFDFLFFSVHNSWSSVPIFISKPTLSLADQAVYLIIALAQYSSESDGDE